MDQSLFVASQAGNILARPRNNSAQSNKMNENLVHLMYKNPCYADSRDKLGFAPMHIASANGYLDIAKEQVRRYGLRVCHLRGGQGDWTPLHCAASRGRLEIIRQLVSACPSSFQDVTRQWVTALHIACKTGQIEAIVLLIQLVVDSKMIAVDSKRRIMNMKDELGDSVLHLAISKRQHYVVKCLVESGLVELNLVDNVGRTALDRVLGLEKINKVAYAAARITEKILRDAGGLTARDLAEFHSHAGAREEVPSSRIAVENVTATSTSCCCLLKSFINSCTSN